MATLLTAHPAQMVITLLDPTIMVQDNEIRVVPKAEALRRIQQMVLDRVPPERSLSEELSWERREEAARE